MKLRGFRIELGEIESALERIAGVRRAIVVVWQQRGDARLVAYVTADGMAPDALKAQLRAWLPEYMVPTTIVAVERFPLTPNGKIDRRALPNPQPADASRAITAPRTDTERLIAELWRELLGVERVGVDDNFFELGGHSLLLARAHAALEQRLARKFAMVEMLRATRRSRTLAAFLDHGGDGDRKRRSGSRPQRRRGARPARRATAPGRAAQAARPLVASARDRSAHIAVVGMAGRFPGADSVDAFWRNLLAGVESVTRFTDDELRADGVSEATLADARYVRARAAITDADHFDAAAFGMSPREAQITDPQHRLMLEVTWHALEHAGIDPARTAGSIGIYGSVTWSSYLLQLLARPDVIQGLDAHQVMFGNAVDYVAAAGAAYKPRLGAGRRSSCRRRAHRRSSRRTSPARR